MRTFPWYDAGWLRTWFRCRDQIAAEHPERLEQFVGAFDVLRTQKHFAASLVEVVDPDTHDALVRRARKLERGPCEHHEMRGFGRLVVHDDPFVTEVQHTLNDRVVSLAGEPVEPAYNFLSFYADGAKCPLHLDAPEAKWTIDHCLDRSPHHWPIEISETIDWPDGRWLGGSFDRRNLSVQFEAFELAVGESLIFSGSAQWHGRSSAAVHGENFFRTMLFLHYVPAGTSELLDPSTWPERFSLPNLDVRYG